MFYDVLGPVGFALLTLLVLSRRARRSFGPQRVDYRFLGGRAVLTGALSALVLWLPFVVVWAKVVGLSVGFGLALVALLSTRFDPAPAGWRYTPNRYIGLVVMSALVGRLTYRIIFEELTGPPETGGTAAAATPAWHANPISAVLILSLLGYYAFYSLGIVGCCCLRRTSR